MFERLGKDTLYYGLSTFFVRGIQIILIPVYSRMLGAAEYGIVETVAIAGALVNLTVALEISQGMARYIADAPDQSARRRYASTALAFSLLAYGLFILIIISISDFLSAWLLGERASTQTLLAACGALAASGIFVLLQDLLRWELRPRAYLTAGIAYSLGSAAFGIFMVVFLDSGVIGVFWGQLAGATLGLMVSAFGSKELLGREFDLPGLRQMLRYSTPLVLSGIAVFVSLFADRIIVRELLGLDALGIYGIAARFASVISILTVGLQAALSPLIFRNWRKPEAPAVLARVCRYYCAGMVPLIGGLALFSGEIMELMTGPEFHDGRIVLPLLSLAAMFSTLYIFAPGLFLGMRTGHVAALNIGGAFVNFMLALWLVPGYGIVGAAIASVVTTAAVFSGFVVLGQAYFPVSYQAKNIATSLSISAGMVVFVMASTTAAPAWSTTQIVIKAVLLLISTIAAVMIGLCKTDRALAISALQALTGKSQ